METSTMQDQISPEFAQMAAHNAMDHVAYGMATPMNQFETLAVDPSATSAEQSAHAAKMAQAVGRVGLSAEALNQESLLHQGALNFHKLQQQQVEREARAYHEEEDKESILV